MAKLFRRRACYSELMRYDEIVLGYDEGSVEFDEVELIYQACDSVDSVSSEFAAADEVEEISPDDLDDEEAQKVAYHLAEKSEYERIQALPLQAVREWLKRKIEEKEVEEDM